MRRAHGGFWLRSESSCCRLGRRQMRDLDFRAKVLRQTLRQQRAVAGGRLALDAEKRRGPGLRAQLLDKLPAVESCQAFFPITGDEYRSEERRVGKECRSR